MGTIGIELLELNDNDEVVKDLTQSSVQKTKLYIQENLLGCSFELFKSSIVVSSSEFMNFYEGMGKQTKRNYIENIFNLSCFGTMFSDIKADINDIKKEITYTNTDIIKNSKTLAELQDKFKIFDSKVDDDLLKLKNEILVKYDKLKKIKKSLVCMESSAVDVNQLKSEKTKLKDTLNTIDSAKNKLSNAITKQQIKIESIQHNIIEFEKLKEGVCEKCTQLIKSHYNYALKLKNIDELTETLNSFSTKLDILSEKYTKYYDDYTKYSDKILEANDNMHKIDTLKQSVDYISTDIKRIKTDYDSLKTNNMNPFTELINKTSTNLNILKDQLNTYNTNQKHLNILKEACSENGVKRLIIKDIIKLLNSLIQKYLNEIGTEFLVYFDETLDFRFLTQNGECEFSSFSAGEKQRIQIATILAFRDLILNGKIASNIFIIDELLDANIDTICIENVMNILKRKSKENNQNTFIISHRSELAENECWDNIIEIIKQNSKSTIKIH